jgi:hypothetical protein
VQQPDLPIVRQLWASRRAQHTTWRPQRALEQRARARALVGGDQRVRQLQQPVAVVFHRQGGQVDEQLALLILA